jgi:hypothetical protein
VQVLRGQSRTGWRRPTTGLRVVDLWETQEQFDRFAQEQIMPATKEAGFQEPPETRIYEVHNHFTPG